MKITLNKALTYGDDSGDGSLDVNHDNNSNGEVKEEIPTPLQIINAYLGVILNEIISLTQLRIKNILYQKINW